MSRLHLSSILRSLGVVAVVALVLVSEACLAPSSPDKITPYPPAGTSKINQKDGQTYVWIPPGSFSMGCSTGDGECRESETPRHEVMVTHGFWLGQTEVTQAAYQRVTGKNPSRFKGAHLPVQRIGWDEARAYCKSVGGWLPTQAQWEYAARGGTSSSRYGALGDIAWYVDNSANQAHEVGQKKANGYGLYDMLGNVEEWTADFPNDYSPGAAADPTGHASWLFRWLIGCGSRGGSFYSDSKEIRVSALGLYGLNARFDQIGVRCVADLAGLR